MEPYISLLDKLETKLDEKGEMNVAGFSNTAEFFIKLKEANQAYLSSLPLKPKLAKEFLKFYDIYRARYIQKNISGLRVELHRSFDQDTLANRQLYPTVDHFYGKITDLNKLLESHAREMVMKNEVNNIGQEACIRINIERHRIFDLLMKLSNFQVDGKPAIEILNAEQAGIFFSHFVIDAKGEFLNPRTAKNHLTKTSDITKKPFNQLYVIDEVDNTLLTTYKNKLNKKVE